MSQFEILIHTVYMYCSSVMAQYRGTGEEVGGHPIPVSKISSSYEIQTGL